MRIETKQGEQSTSEHQCSTLNVAKRKVQESLELLCQVHLDVQLRSTLKALHLACLEISKIELTLMEKISKLEAERWKDEPSA